MSQKRRICGESEPDIFQCAVQERCRHELYRLSYKCPYRQGKRASVLHFLTGVADRKPCRIQRLPLFRADIQEAHGQDPERVPADT